MKRTSTWLALALVGLTASASAQTTEQRVLKCAGIPDDVERLACFDTLARGLQATQPGIEAREEHFGLEHRDPKAGLPADIRATVTELGKNAHGALIFMLDNGQAWEQKDSKAFVVRAGDAVVIERGSLSAFYLSAGGGKRIRVARIR